MDEFLRLRQLTALLGISRASVYRRMKDGLPYVKIGGLTRFPKGRVIAWLEGRGSGGEILPAGDYRCLGCGWIGHLERPRPTSELRCPRCATKGRVEPVLS